VAHASWKFRREWLWPVLVAGLIIAASSRSRVAAPEGIAHVDKIAHFSVYGLLATLLCRLQPGWRGAAWGLAGASLFGMTDEWHQSFVPGRATDVGDWVADTAGAAVAVGLYAGVGWYRRALEMPVWRGRAVVVQASGSERG